MPKSKTTYLAANGREFESIEEAERYEVMKKADEEFTSAVNLYNASLAKALKTADGYPFALGTECYVVWDRPYNCLITHECFHARHTRIEWDGCREPVILFDKLDSGERKRMEIGLSGVYVKERNAKLELLAIRRKRLEWLKGDVEKLEKELGIEKPAATDAA